MAEWARLAATTIADYAQGVEDRLKAKRVLLAAMKKSGNILYNRGGNGFNWAVAYRQAPLNTNTMQESVTPTQQDRYKRASLEYVGYDVHDAITKRERLQNKGPGALIDYMEEMTKNLTDDITQRFSEELYIDSSATGNSQRLTGVESMFAGTQTVTITSGAARTANAADVALYPSDTYAGLSTILGNYGGSWGTQTAISSTWPAGRGELQYDFYSPIVVNYTSTAFSGSADTWAEQCVESTRFLIVHMSRYESDMGDMQVVLLDRELYRQYLQKLDSKERINTSSALGLRSLGFQNTFQQDGVDITWEFGMPSAVGYGYNIKHMQLRSCQDRLFKTEGPTWEPLQRMFWVIIDFYGQLKFHSPRFFGKLATIA